MKYQVQSYRLEERPYELEAELPAVNSGGQLFLYGPLVNGERNVVAVFSDWTSCIAILDSQTTQSYAPMPDEEFVAGAREIIAEMERVAPPRVQSCAKCGHIHLTGESCADAIHRLRQPPIETEYE